MATRFPGDLTTQRIRLRKFEANDASWVAAACDRPEMARFVPVLPSPYTEEDASIFISYAEQAWEDDRSAPFAIESVDGEPLGAVELHFSATNRGLAGVGYWLRPEGRGRGAATDAVRLVCEWSFRELAIERMNLITDPENLPSQRVAERAGFSREGLLRGWHPTRQGRRDSVMFSLLPGDSSSP